MLGRFPSPGFKLAKDPHPVPEYRYRLERAPMVRSRGAVTLLWLAA